MCTKDIHFIVVLQQKRPIFGLHLRASFLWLNHKLLFMTFLFHFDGLRFFSGFLFTHVEYQQQNNPAYLKYAHRHDLATSKIIYQIISIFLTTHAIISLQMQKKLTLILFSLSFNWLNLLLSLGNRSLEFPLDTKSYKSRKIRGCFVYDNYRHSYFILNKSLRSQMASSYNLRTRTKEHSPASKKASVQIHQQLAKQSPKTAHKPTYQKPTPTISPSKVISMSSSATITTNQLFPLTHHHNNEISNGELNSNSQLDSLINNSMEKKNKMDQVQHSKQEDAIQSIVLEEGGFLGRFNGLKGLKRHHSAMEMETEKKQYRSVKHPVVLGVPYRKFQTQLEQKIVGLINKIKQQKNCAKEIEKLFHKIQNAPQKDLKNRYFISGVAVILKLMRQSQQNYYSTQFQQQSQSLFGNLKRRIQVELLDNVSNFQEEQKPANSFNLSKEKMINRVFKILLKKFKFAEKMDKQTFNREEIQNKSISFVNQFDTLNQTSTKILYERIGL